ncbi:hypothetical protein C8R44DRAFT_886156 [Mycena epipterygia]|nr:hypothetical protein C8R44DRAFT_886156 [Mycena epipterygia]
MLQMLDYLQQHHIARRDLRSDSWLLNSQGVLKLTDFSNAVLVKPETPLSMDPAGVVYCRRPFRSTLWRRALERYDEQGHSLVGLDLINCTSGQSAPSAGNPSSRNVSSAAQLQSETSEPGVVTPVDPLKWVDMICTILSLDSAASASSNGSRSTVFVPSWAFCRLSTQGTTEGNATQVKTDTTTH